MADGSKMRFIPIVKGYVDDNEAREKLYRHLKHQATSKAGEVKLNFPYQDVNTRKSYFGEKTLEQVIHEMTTKKDTEVPIFKHITTKWMQKDTGIQQYEIAVANSLVDEATAVLRGLKNYLIKTYGNDARNHFAGAKNDKKIAIPRKRNFTLFNTDWDDDIGKFIKQTDNTDKLSKVLIEGMEMILDPQNMNYQNKNDKEGALVFNEAPKHKEEETKTKDTKEPKEVEKKITNINRKLEKKDIIVIDDEDEQRQVQENAQSEAINQGGKYLEQKEWYDIALGGEYERCIVATDDEKRKTRNTLRKYKIDVGMIEQWKNKNWTKILPLLEECRWKEYSMMKRIVEEIKEQQEGQKPAEEIQPSEKEGKRITEQNRENNNNQESDDKKNKEKCKNTNFKTPPRTNHPKSEKSPPPNAETVGVGRAV